MGLLRRIALGLAASTLGCVINVGEDDCSECDNAPRCHSHLDEATQQCFCDPGHTWANPGNDNDFECKKIPPKPGTSQCIEEHSYMLDDSCFCEPGFKWCSSDLDDLTCCLDEEQASTGAMGTEPATDTDLTAGESGDREIPLPACTAEIEGQFGCTNPDPGTPQPAFQCVGGAWVDLDEDAHCQNVALGDFAYGCWLDVDAAVPVVIECAFGPGSACVEADRICIDDTTLHFCEHARLTARNCNEFCVQQAEMAGRDETMEHGRCEAADCICCNDADGTCPM